MFHRLVCSLVYLGKAGLWYGVELWGLQWQLCNNSLNTRKSLITALAYREHHGKEGVWQMDILGGFQDHGKFDFPFS